MKKLQTLKFNQLKINIRGLPKKLAEKAFLSFLGLFILSVIFGSFIFYSYGIAPKEEITDTGRIGLQFKSDLYSQVLEIWNENEQSFKETDAKQYPNLFIK